MPGKNVSAVYPPTVLIHGTADTDVPFEQSQMLGREEKIPLKEAPVTVQQAIANRLHTAEHLRVTRRCDGDDTEFDVIALKDGSLEVFTLSPAGKIDTPGP